MFVCFGTRLLCTQTRLSPHETVALSRKTTGMEILLAATGAAFASAVTEAYTLVYMALLDPNNGYGRNAIDAMKHGPNALSTVLGVLY